MRKIKAAEGWDLAPIVRVADIDEFIRMVELARDNGYSFDTTNANRHVPKYLDAEENALFIGKLFNDGTIEHCYITMNTRRNECKIETRDDNLTDDEVDDLDNLDSFSV